LKIEIKSSFARDLRKVRGEEIRERVKNLISRVENADSIESVPGIKRLQTDGPYYHIRLGDYRVGVSVRGETVTFIRLLHRKDIYRYFP
jgi:mRNA interferase RelE/StbE